MRREKGERKERETRVYVYMSISSSLFDDLSRGRRSEKEVKLFFVNDCLLKFF